MKLTGMFEVKKGQDYVIYKNINEDPFTWKPFNLSDSIYKNQHDMVEIRINTTDVDLLGSGSSVEKMPEVLSRFQLTLDTHKMELDAYNNCQNNKACKAIISTSNAEIMNYYYSSAYNVANSKPMT